MYTPYKMKGPSLYKKMDPMYNGKPGVQKEDFKQFSESPNKKYKTAMKKMGCAMCDYGKKKCTCGKSPMSKRGCKKKY